MVKKKKKEERDMLVWKSLFLFLTTRLMTKLSEKRSKKANSQ